MRSRALPAMGLSVVALALATSMAIPASASDSAGITASTSGAGTTATIQAKACASNTDLDGNGLTSQNFEAAYDQYDANGAADFKLRKDCAVKKVAIYGSFSAAGPARDVTVMIYKKNPNGSPVCEATGGGAGPNFLVKVSGCDLSKGKYWLTAQANMDFGSAGQWYWSTAGAPTGETDLWHNPGGGFGVGCTDYDTNLVCLGYDLDYSFAVGPKVKL